MTLCIVLIFCMFNIGYAWEWRSRENYESWHSEEEAQRIATELKQAESVQQTEDLIYEVLELLEIQVHDEMGRIVLQGNEYISEEFYLYDFQVTMLAEAFQEKEKRYTPLNNVVQLWQDLGLVITKEDGFRDLIDPVETETAMRSLREWAEENPEDPGGFVIRLIDELGDRKIQPFNLLEEELEEEESEDQKVTMRKRREDEYGIYNEIEKMLEHEDIELSEEDKDKLAEGAISGSLRTMLSAFANEEELEEIEKGISETIGEIEKRKFDPDLSQEERKNLNIGKNILETADKALKIEDTESIEHFDEMSEQIYQNMISQKNIIKEIKENEIKQAKEKLKLISEEQVEEQKKDKDRNKWEDPLYQAQQIGELIGIINSLRDIDLSLETATEQIEVFKQAQEWVEVEKEEKRKEMENMPEPPLRAGGEEDKPRSALMLDPLQSLLLQLDLLILTRDNVESGLHRSTKLLFFPLNRVEAAGGSREVILGTLGEGLDNFFDSALTEFLDNVTDEAFSRIKNRIDIPEKILDILHGTIIMLAHKVEMEIYYLPDDAELGRRIEADATEPTPGIRLRDHLNYGERFSKEIRLRVTVIFDPPEAVNRVEFGRLAAMSFSEQAAPWLRASTILGPAGGAMEQARGQLIDKLANLEFPEPGPQPEVPVKINYERLGLMQLVETDDEQLKHYVEIKPEEWDYFGARIVETDENGVAEVSFYPKKDSNMALKTGGEPEWIRDDGFLIRAHPLTQTPDSFVLDYQDVAFAMADHLKGLFPGLGSGDIRIYIERLKPTPWQGKVRFKRDVNASFERIRNPRGPSPETRREPNYETPWTTAAHSWESNWDYTYEIDVLLAPNGELVSWEITDFDYDIEQNENSLWFKWHKCEEGKHEERYEKTEKYNLTPIVLSKTEAIGDESGNIYYISDESQDSTGGTLEDELGNEYYYSEDPIAVEWVPTIENIPDEGIFPTAFNSGDLNFAMGEPGVVLDFPEIYDWTQSYRVLVTPPRSPMLLTGIKTTTWQDCEDGDTKTFDVSGLIQMGPRGEIASRTNFDRLQYPSRNDLRWWAYDTLADELTGHITMTENVRLYHESLGDVSNLAPVPDIKINTTLNWELERVFDD